MNWDIYLFEQGFGEAEAERVLVKDGTRHEGAHTVQQLLVFLQHKPWQGGREILGENGARLKTAGDRNKERRQVWWGREYLIYDILVSHAVSCYVNGFSMGHLVVNKASGFIVMSRVTNKI